jgi:protein SCO1/2
MRPARPPRLIAAGVAVLIGALGTAAGCGRGAPPAHDAVRLDEYEFGGDFELTAHDGRPFRLSSARGKVVLLFFGYTSCPDICPMTLATIRQVEARLGPKRDRLLTVFVSVDPERDTPEALAAYLGHFGLNAVAVTGPPPKLDPVVSQYKASYEIVTGDTAMDYLVDHTTTLYLIDRQGKIRYLFGYGDPPERILEGVELLLN